jgi:hypothetical protein
MNKSIRCLSTCYNSLTPRYTQLVVMDVKKMREMFAKGVATWFDMEFMPMSEPVNGVSFVPVHFNTKMGHPCVVLGRERGGGYARLLNFVGGEVEKPTMRYKGMDVAKVLFDEVLEELHLALTPALFGDMLLKVHSVPFADGVSLVFVVHLKGLSRAVWDKEHIARVQSIVPWKFQEMDSIEHVMLLDLPYRKDVSKYVSKLVAEVVASGDMLGTNKGVHRSKFLTAEVRNDGKVTVK